MSSKTDFAAIKEVLERGWVKGVAYSEKGLCLVGGIETVARRLPYEDKYTFEVKMRDILRGVIQEQYPDRGAQMWGISAFNDHPDTVWEDIARVLDKAQVRFG